MEKREHVHQTRYAYTLVKALENFVVPIIRSQELPSVSNQGTEDDSKITSASVDAKESYLSLTPEAQNVLTALEIYFDSLFDSRRSHQCSTNDKPTTITLPAGKTSETVARTESSSKIVPDNLEPLLETALQHAHRHVFNKMPIRLLAFQPDGSGIELVERSTIWGRVSTSIRSNVMDFRMGDTKASEKNVEDFVARHTKYAILSHTWLQDAPGEVTYANWRAGKHPKTSPGYLKLANFCKVAAVDHGITMGWMDTICINKESSSELDESIRSMFKWYRDASVCVTYLAEATSIDKIRTDPWFTRGWTLQELLAPRYIKFYGANWEKFASDPQYDINNQAIQQEIQAATTITQEEMISFQGFRNNTPISRRMQWAAHRRVTREEDIAYSLMGIFDVSMSIAYGEGTDRAFFRLLSEILASGRWNVLDIANWCIGPTPNVATEISQSHVHPSSLLPSNPRQYLWRSEKEIQWFPILTPVALTHVGLRLQILLMEAIAADTNVPYTKLQAMGNYRARVQIDAQDPIDPSKRLPHAYDLLSRKLQTVRNNFVEPSSSRLLFGVLNFGETDETVILPSSTCLAVCLYTHTSSPGVSIETSNIRKLDTTNAITFDIERYETEVSYEIMKYGLKNQGMMLHTLYL